MNTTINKFYVLFAIACLLAACGAGDSKQGSGQAGWTQLETEQYSIQYPETWELDESGLMGTTFVLYADTKDSTDFPENVNLLIHDISAMNVDLAKYIAVSINGIYSYVYNSEIIESETFTLDGRDFNRLLYTGEQGGYKLKWLQYCTIKDQNAYLVTFTSTQSDFGDNVAAGEEIMKSFRLK